MATAARISDEEAATITMQVAIEIGGGAIDEDALYAARRHKTFRHDNPGLVREPGDSQARPMGFRRAGTALTRFSNEAVTEPVDRSIAALDHRHPALRNATTIYPSRVFSAGQRNRVLIPGINNAKIGSRVTKGPWAGMPIFTLSLEERATCPATCPVIRECYGNGMPMAVRFRHNPALMTRLDQELRALAVERPAGFVVRLHVLGDFPDAAYLRRWLDWSRDIPQLHVWGYTAHGRETLIGGMILDANFARMNRWAVRFSVAPDAPRAPMQAAVLWEKPDTLATVDDTLICPQELGKTATCGSCGLCWNPEAAHLRINFFGHGRRA